MRHYFIWHWFSAGFGVAMGIAVSLITAAPASAALPSSSSHYGPMETQRISFNNAPLFKQANEAVIRRDDAAAIQYFNEILKNDPGSNPAKLSLIALYERTKRYDDGIRLCDELIRQYPDFIYSYYSKGYLAMKGEKYDLAATAWQSGLNLAPADFSRRREILKALGQAYAHLGRYSDAASAYAQALAQAFDVSTALEYFYVLKAMKEPEKGQALLERILAGSPPASMKREVSYELAQLDRQAGRMPEYFQRMTVLVRDETDARRLHDYGLQLYSAGAQALALTALTRGFDLALDPGLKFEMGLFAAEMLIEQRRPDNARAWLEKTAPLAGADIRWPLAMARADFLSGNLRACSDRLMALKERPASANLLIGLAFMKRNMPGPALEFFNEIDDPDVLSSAEQLSLFSNRAYLNFDQNQYAAARADAGEALALAPSADMTIVRLKSLANARYELAQLDRQAGRMPEYFQRMTVLVRDETDARRLHDYGLQLYSAGAQALALTALARGFDLALDPGLKFEMGLFTAEMLIEQRQPDNARAWLEKTAPFAGADIRWPLAMARADFLSGNLRACSDRLMALKERPASANLLIGLAFMKRNMPGPALEFFNEIDDPDVLSSAEQLSLFSNRAYLNFDQNQYAAARADAGEALALAPSADMALVYLKSLANVSVSNNIEKAGEQLLNPEASNLLLTGAEQAQVLLVMGRSLNRQEQYDKAVQRLTDAVKLDPSLAEAFYLRGLIYHVLGKSKETLTNYQEYVRLETNPPATFWGDLGQANGKYQEYKKGTDALHQSLDYHSVDVDTLSDQGYQFMKWAFPHQGTNCSIMGRWNHNREAKESFQRAIKLYADLVPRVPTNETAAYREREVAMKQEYTKLDRLFGIQGYVSRTDYGFPTNVPISSVDGALPSQGGLELSLRPPVVGFLNEKTLDIFGQVSGNFKSQTWTPDPDSYQGMVGLRLKPFERLNYNMSFARLFKIGDNAEDNWLWRNMASWEYGEKPAPGKSVGLNLKLFGDAGYYFDPRASWYGYLDGRAGPSWRLHQNALLTLPQVMGIMRYETNDKADTGSYGLMGIGATLRLFEPERRYTINRLYVDIFAYYTWGQFMSTPNGFDGRSFEGPMIGISLVK